MKDSQWMMKIWAVWHRNRQIQKKKPGWIKGRTSGLRGSPLLPYWLNSLMTEKKRLNEKRWFHGLMVLLTTTGSWAEVRWSWLVETFLPQLWGLGTQATASCGLITGMKGVRLSTSGEGQKPGFTFRRSELLPRSCPSRRDETLKREPAKAAPTITNYSCSISYTCSAPSSILRKRNIANCIFLFLKMKLKMARHQTPYNFLESYAI